jgi:hypothetical protein
MLILAGKGTLSATDALVYRPLQQRTNSIRCALFFDQSLSDTEEPACYGWTVLLWHWQRQVKPEKTRL